MKNSHEEKLRTSERFIFVYKIAKFKHLKDSGFDYLFKCLNEGSGNYFFVFDNLPEIRECLREYNRDNPYIESKRG